MVKEREKVEDFKRVAITNKNVNKGKGKIISFLFALKLDASAHKPW